MYQQSHITLFTLTLNGLIINFIKNFIAEEDGITAIEYALMAALIAAGVAAAVVFLTDGLTAAFTKIKTKLSA